MRQARFEAKVVWPKEQGSDDESRRARRNGLLAVAAAIALGALYTRYAGSVAIEPELVRFQDQVVGGPAGRAEVKLTGQGTRGVKVGPAALEGEGSTSFKIGKDTCPVTALEPDATCSISLEFTPASAGLHTAWLAVADESSDEPRRIALVGLATSPPATSTGKVVEDKPAGSSGSTVSETATPTPRATPVPTPTGPAGIEYKPRSLVFGRQAMGTAGAPQTIGVLSTGDRPLNIRSVELRGDASDFTVAGDGCIGQQLSKGGTCRIDVAFSPRQGGKTGDRRARLVIQDNTSQARHMANLTGRATPAAAALTVTPAAPRFPDQILGGRSSPMVLTVANRSGSQLGPVKVNLYDQTNFAMGTDKCTGTTLQPSGRCEFEVLFTPTDSKTLIGSLDVRAGVQTQLVFMSGKGIDPGWCCIRQSVSQLDAQTCVARRGTHFATKQAAEKACQPPPPQQPQIK